MASKIYIGSGKAKKNSSHISSPILRYFLEIAYKGTHYHGWQIQENAHSVQQELNHALEKLFRQKVNTYGSGRTDTGVHAEQQFVQIDLDMELSEEHLFKINRMLPFDIVVKAFYKVHPEATARHDAVRRKYEYRISRVKNPFLNGLVFFFGKPLDVDSMNQAALEMKKYKNFQSFSRVNTSVDHFLCDIVHAVWEERGDLLIFHIEANRFLRGMVRSVVGTLLQVGEGKISIPRFREIIESFDRKQAGMAAPPEGLFLVKVEYPEEIFLKE